jgi:hypothetical protein
MSFHRATLVALASLLTVGMTSLAEAQQAAIGGYGAVWGTSSVGSWCAGGYAPGTVYAPATDYPIPVGNCYPGYGYYPSRSFISRPR